MRRARGLLVAGVVVAALEAATGVVGMILLGPVEIVFFLLACGAATAAVMLLAAFLASSRRSDDDGDGGGGGPGDDDPPPWWPEFERDFWHHVRDRGRLPA